MEALVNGIHLHHVQAGNGIPLLLIHGYPLDHALWQPQVNGLADTNVARVIAPDLRDSAKAMPPKAPTRWRHTPTTCLRCLTCFKSSERGVRAFDGRIHRAGVLAEVRQPCPWADPGGHARRSRCTATRQARLDMVEQVKQHGSAPAADAMLPACCPSPRAVAPRLGGIRPRDDAAPAADRHYRRATGHG